MLGLSRDKPSLFLPHFPHRAASDTKFISATSAKSREPPDEPASCRTPSTGEQGRKEKKPPLCKTLVEVKKEIDAMQILWFALFLFPLDDYTGSFSPGLN